MKGHYERYKQQIFDRLGNSCNECGSGENLHFHHREQKSKRFSLTPKLTANLNEEFWEEVDKCEVLCYTCHSKKHATEHGKRAMYNKGCRCEFCVAAARNDMREYRQRKRNMAR